MRKWYEDMLLFYISELFMSKLNSIKKGLITQEDIFVEAVDHYIIDLFLGEERLKALNDYMEIKKLEYD